VGGADVSGVARKLSSVQMNTSETRYFSSSEKLEAKQRFRCLMVITGLSTGGAETMLLKLAPRLLRSMEVHVVSLGSLGEIGPKLIFAGVNVTALGMNASWPEISAVYRLRRFIHDFSPDVVMTWMYHADLVGGVAARLAGVRAVAWNVRHSSAPSSGTKLSTSLVIGSCRLFSKFIPAQIVSCSQVARDLHVAIGYRKDNWTVIPNGFDLSSFHPDQAARDEVRQELGVAPNAPLIGLIARWDPQKNHRGFIQMAAKISTEIPDAHFLLAGREIDSGNSTLMKWVQDAGLASRVHLLGLRADVPRLTAALDVATLVSSFGEAFPNAVGEAMACGIPCVVTDVGDSAEIVGDTGIVCRPDDLDALAASCIRLLQSEEAARLHLGALARERVSSSFDIEEVARQYAEFLRALPARAN
jgi:glycosyltransferase involved in cell wall biosynthesis